MPATALKDGQVEAAFLLILVPIPASEQTSSHVVLPGLVYILFVLSLPAQVGGLLLRFLGLFREALPRLIIEQLPVGPM